MTPFEHVRGRATVIQPHEGDSFWQPVPANGHADPKLTPAKLQICFRGQGRVVVDGVSHPLVPGTACSSVATSSTRSSTRPKRSSYKHPAAPER